MLFLKRQHPTYLYSYFAIAFAVSKMGLGTFIKVSAICITIFLLWFVQGFVQCYLSSFFVGVVWTY